MGAKLTLNVDESVVGRAKRYARSRGRSLSWLVEQYLRFVTEMEEPPSEVSDSVRRLADNLKPSVSDDELKRQYLSEKYLHASDSD